MYTFVLSLQPLDKHYTGTDPGFQVRGAHLRKLRRAEWGAKIFGRTILKKVLIMSCLKMFTQSYHRVYKKAASRSIEYLIFRKIGGMYQGRIRDFKLGGGALKKIAPSGGRRENCWGISCEKSRFYVKK